MLPVVLARIGDGRMDFDRVLPNLLVGSYPRTINDIESLQREQGVSAVLNLQTDEDYERLRCDWPCLAQGYRQRAIEVCRQPVRDFDGDDLALRLPECVAALADLLDRGHTVYVHCTAGMGRSASVVIAYLHWVRKRDLDEAIQCVTDCHMCLPNDEAIRQATPAARDREV
jgi:protein-tyrosine phosphatase